MLTEGERSAFFAMDIESPEQMYNACEALLILGVEIYRDIIMTFDQIKKGLYQSISFYFVVNRKVLTLSAVNFNGLNHPIKIGYIFVIIVGT